MSAWDDIRDFDFNNAHAWSPGAKAVVVIVICAIIIAVGLYFFIKPRYEAQQQAQQQEQTLRDTFKRKQKKAANLEAYKEQLEQMKEIYGAMLRQLPSKTEMPELLVDISQTALATGIETELFQPGDETVKEFYAELPIQLRMKGRYHQFGDFISGVASLPRIVILTMHDISLQPVEGTPGRLVLKGTAKTYRYVEAGENVFEDTKKESGS